VGSPVRVTDPLFATELSDPVFRRDPKPTSCCQNKVLLCKTPLSARMVLESAQEALTAAKQSIMGEGKKVALAPTSCSAQSLSVPCAKAAFDPALPCFMPARSAPAQLQLLNAPVVHG